MPLIKVSLKVETLDGIESTFTKLPEFPPPKTPLVVLVNRGTASASEVLSGALKDNGRAVLAGENTFGKGLIQTLVELSDGSAVAVTVAKYQTPAGIDINKIGIKPQVVLDAEALTALPFNGQEFCKYASTDAAPKLFG